MRPPAARPDRSRPAPRRASSSSVAKLTLGRCPSEKALGSHGISSEASLCQNSGSKHKNLPPLALERTSPNFHMLAWLVILFCPRLKKIGPSMRNCLSRALACACFVVLVVIVKHAETAGAVLRHKVDWQSPRGGRVGGRFPGHRVSLTWSGPARSAAEL